MPKTSPPLHHFARLLGGEVRGGQILCPGPGHSAADRSLAVKVSDGDDIVVYSFSGDDVIACKDFVRVKLGFPAFTPKKKINGKDDDKPRKVIVAEYDYVDESGALLFQVVRFEGKTFRQRRPDGNGGWDWKLGDVRRVPFKFPELIEGIGGGHPVFIVEGERDVLTLNELGIVATTNAGGAGKWRPEFSQHLRGADVILVPDNDDAGWEHINQIGAQLHGVAARVRVLVLPNLPPKGDVSDWIASGGTREQLDALLENAHDWKPPSAAEVFNKHTQEEKAIAKAREDELLDAFAKTEGLDYARQLKATAKELRLPSRAIDSEVRARREDAKTAPLYGHWIVEPWPDPVEGDSLLRDIIRRFQRHVVITEENALTIALWIMLSWVHDEIATHSPILNINSAEPESGKSTTMDLIAFLMPRCIASVDVTEAAIYRAIKRWTPSFCIDEFDDALRSNDPNKTSLRSVINSGHTRGSGVLRCVGKDDKVPELFPTFAAKAIGMIGRKLPPQTLSRCIFVELRRRKRDESVVEFKRVDDAELADLRRRLRRWAIDNQDTLRDAKPSMPDELYNRRADNWKLQLAIADLAGLDWGDKARVAAVAIERKGDNRTTGARALTDARSIFYPQDADERTLKPLERISSAGLATQLAAYDDSPWAEFRHGKPITQAQLARVLKPFGISPQVIRLDGETTMRGYLRTQFEDAWERYL